MAKRSLILHSTSAKGNSISKAITDINPSVGGDTLKTFTQKLNALTTNTYTKTECIDKRIVDSEEVPVLDVRPTPSITFSDVPTLAQAKNGTYMGITYTGDGQLYAYTKSGLNNMLYRIIGNNQMMMGAAPNSSGQTAGTIVIGAFGTDNYKPVEAEVNIE